MAISGAQALLDMLYDSGVRYLFGNPGTTELPLMDALAHDRRIQYVLGLQEVPVVAMADGFAQASGQLGVANLHISCGLGNAMGMLYNAFRSGTPLLITAGQQDRRLATSEPILWSDMVAVVRPWTKWAAEVERIDDLPALLRRAVQAATTPPTGPVFLSLPIDLQMQLAELELLPATRLDSRIRPPAAALDRAAELLAKAKNPAILSGSRVVEADAVAQVVALADQLGAPVFTESGTTHGRLGFPADHALYGQALPLWAPEVHERLAEFDVLLVVGMDLLQLYVYFEPPLAIPKHIRLVHLDHDARQLGKNFLTEVGLIGDPQAGLTELIERVAELMSPSAAAAARRRGESRKAAHLERRQKLWQRVEQERQRRPMTALTLMSTLARVLPKNVTVVEEAITTTNTYFERLGALPTTSGYFAQRGWALGWGLGCALGVKLAWPDRPLLAILGEGAAMYGIQGLWTAAHYRIPVTFVVPNNAQYHILKVGSRQLRLPAALRGEFESLDLSTPEIDLVGLARSMGVEAERVTESDALAERVAESLSGDVPRLFDVPIERTIAGQ